MAHSILLKFESMSAGADEEGKDLVGGCMCVCARVRWERGVCLPTIASLPLIACQGFDEESQCTSFLRDNSYPTCTRVCILLFLHTHTFMHTHFSLICLFAFAISLY